MKHLFRKMTAALLVLLTVMAVGMTTAFAVDKVDESQITSNVAMLVDQYTGKVLYKKNADKKIYPASTAKIMTATILLDEVDAGKVKLDDVVTVGDEIKGMQGSAMGLTVGDKIKYEELLYGMMMKSGNDAALVIAKNIGGSISGFVKLMTAKAKELGMDNSTFTNPNGLDKQKPQVTAADMAKLTKYATKFSILKTIGSSTTHSAALENDGKILTLVNTNQLIYHDDKNTKATDYRYKYATGLKTGQTPKAGSCLIATGEKDGQKLIALVYGDESKSGNDRWKIAKYLLEYGFNNYESYDMEQLAEKCGNLTVTVSNAAKNDEGKGVLKCTPVISDDENEKITLTSDDIASGLKAKVTPKDGLTAPVNEGDVVGTVSITVGSNEVFKGNVVASRSVYSEEQVSSKGSSSPVSTIAPTKIDDTKKALGFKDIWYWLIIPAALIAFLVIRGFVIKGRHHRRYGRGSLNSGRVRRRGGYSYKIKKHRRRGF